MKKIIPFLALCLLALAACTSNSNQALPILGKDGPMTKIVNGKTITVYDTIPAFKFVNQYGDSISDKSMNGKIYVADFFFTSCPSICPVMHRNMLKVYAEFKNSTDIKILSHSIDPKYDSVKVLKKYADKLGVSGNTWWFLQGKKDETYELAHSYMTSASEDNKAPGGFAHDGAFILVDKQKHMRGVYDGTKPEEADRLIKDIRTLQAEPDQSIAQ